MTRSFLALLTAGMLACGGSRPPSLLTFDEFTALAPRAPYIVRLRHDSSGGELLYYGARHTNDPTDPQIDEIERLWRSFRPTMAFNEGGNPPVPATRELAVRRIGEPGWVRFLAIRDSVPVTSLEPTRSAEVAALRRTFSGEHLKLFYVLRQVPSYGPRGDARPVDQALAEEIRRAARTPGLEGPPNTVEELVAACRRLLPQMPDCRDARDAWFNPTLHPENGWTNEVSRQSGYVRDVHMVELLANAVRGGARVFAVVGFGHVVMQERVLRHRLGAAR